MASRGRGGYQKPSKPAAVSGPGALARRTDTGQPQSNIPSQGYGERVAREQQQSMAPLRAGGISTPPAAPTGDPSSAEAVPGFDVWAPTERPSEPPTAGAALGPGAGPDVYAMQADYLRGLLNHPLLDDEDRVEIEDMLNELREEYGA